MLNESAQTLWQAFLHNKQLEPQHLHVTASMPGNREIADHLISLYLEGKKTAGSGLVRDFELAGDPLPTVGNYWIILDSIEKARCIAKTIRTEIYPFNKVTDEVVIAEGEGDLSREYWLEAHRKFFLPYLNKLQIEDLNNALVVTEFFEITIL